MHKNILYLYGHPCHSEFMTQKEPHILWPLWIVKKLVSPILFCTYL